MQKLTTREIINAIKRDLWLLLTIGLLVAGLVLGLQRSTGGKYEAEAVLMVTSNDDEPITYNKLIFNERLANVYAQFLESDDLYKKVEENGQITLPEAKDIKNSLEYTVNPQGGVIVFNYSDAIEGRSVDTLTLITEEFRTYAKDYLGMENIEYLQKPAEKSKSNVRSMLFIIAGFILGALIGILISIIKEILTDRIYSTDDIREMGIEVLADVTNDEEIEYAKVKRRLETVADKAVVGICPVSEKLYEKNITEKLAEIIKAPIVDPEKVKASDEGLIDIKYKLNKYTQDYPYVLVNEKNTNDPLSVDIAALEDYKILVVGGDKLYKNDLNKTIAEFTRLGIKVLGVIYHK